MLEKVEQFLNTKCTVESPGDLLCNTVAEPSPTLHPRTIKSEFLEEAWVLILVSS